MKLPTNFQLSQNRILMLVTAIAVLFGLWGAYTWYSNRDQNTITVSGYAQAERANQVATLNFGVSTLDANKNTAVQQTNEKAEAVMSAIRELGISEDNIQTVNLNVYQEQYWDENTQRPVYTDWRASIDVEVWVKDLSVVPSLMANVTELDINNVWGPNYQLENQQAYDAELLANAMADARKKAEAIAQASGRRLGKMVHFEDVSGGYGYPIAYMERGMADSVGMGSGSETSVMPSPPTSPGTSDVTKTINVTFVLK